MDHDPIGHEVPVWILHDNVIDLSPARRLDRNNLIDRWNKNYQPSFSASPPMQVKMFVVFAMMLRRALKLKVFRTIVGSVFILVMDLFRPDDKTTKLLLHHENMLIYDPAMGSRMIPLLRNLYITIRIYKFPAFPGMVHALGSIHASPTKTTKLSVFVSRHFLSTATSEALQDAIRQDLIAHPEVFSRLP
jgi:hypothetical protein